MALQKAMVSSKSNEWATPQDLFDELHKEFNFTLDPSSTKENKKCSKHYTIEDDGLSKDWSKEVVFMNPPYGGHTGDWIKKAYESSLKGAIDAALVSAQRRKRLFWTNIPGVTLPEDKRIFLKDILESIPLNDLPRTYWRETKGGNLPTLTANMGTGGHNVPFIQQTARGYNKGGQKFDKVPTLSSSAWEHNHKLNNIRKLTPVECERLQGLPDGYTEGVSNTQRYKALGNAFNVDVVAHILSYIPR